MLQLLVLGDHTRNWNKPTYRKLQKKTTVLAEIWPTMAGLCLSSIFQIIEVLTWRAVVLGLDLSIWRVWPVCWAKPAARQGVGMHSNSLASPAAGLLLTYCAYLPGKRTDTALLHRAPVQSLAARPCGCAYSQRKLRLNSLHTSWASGHSQSWLCPSEKLAVMYVTQCTCSSYRHSSQPHI